MLSKLLFHTSFKTIHISKGLPNVFDYFLLAGSGNQIKKNLCSVLKYVSLSQKELEVEEDKVTCQTVQDTKCNENIVGYSKQVDCVEWPREECTVARVTVKKTIPDTRCEKIPTRICL